MAFGALIEDTYRGGIDHGEAGVAVAGAAVQGEDVRPCDTLVQGNLDGDVVAAGVAVGLCT